MGILSGYPKDEPLHYGEVFSIWTNVATNNGLIAAYQTFINHTGDKDLAKILDESIECMKDENKQLEIVLKINGIGLPPAPPERPQVRLEDIPVGARFNDPEISAALSMNSSAGLVASSKAMAICIREDIALMFGQFQLKKVQIGAKLLRLNKDKGWLIPPPLHLNIPGKE